MTIIYSFDEHQLPGVPPEEELEQREVSDFEVHHGPAAAHLWLSSRARDSYDFDYLPFNFTNFF